jgi:hypothetical protein
VNREVGSNKGEDCEAFIKLSIGITIESFLQEGRGSATPGSR